VLLLALFAGACGGAKRVGDPCRRSEDCPGRPQWPATCDLSVKNGACTAVCDADVDCGDSSSLCAELRAGVKRCAPRCEEDASCRVSEGFVCATSLEGRRHCAFAPGRDGGAP